MPDDADCQLTQLVILAVSQSLGRSDHNRFTCMDAKRVEILHIADRYAVVMTVAHHFIFHFLPSAQTFLHKHLWRESEGLFRKRVQLGLIVAEAGPQPSECICGAYDYRIAQL